MTLNLNGQLNVPRFLGKDTYIGTIQLEKGSMAFHWPENPTPSGGKISTNVQRAMTCLCLFDQLDLMAETRLCQRRFKTLPTNEISQSSRFPILGVGCSVV
jgi:hypothetical protein